MDAFEAEERRQHILSLLADSTSYRQRLYILKDYYTALLNNSSKLIAESFIAEFLDEFLECAERFEVFYASIKISAELLDILNKFKSYSFAENKKEKIESVHCSINSKLNSLNKILEDRGTDILSKNKLYFPLLEKNNSGGSCFFWGILETITITIRRNNEKDNFIIVHSMDLNNNELNDQVKQSWAIACSYLRGQDGKIKKYHTVIINFDNQLGIYTGISLGAALTVGFIEELINFYNLPYRISIMNHIAVTGGFDDYGNLISIKEDYIEKKLEIVFYSPIKIFIVPKENTAYSERYLKKLKMLHPARNLEIIGIKNLQDLFNRRNLVEINKKNVLKRLASYIKKNWKASILFLIVIFISGYFYEINFDDNPAILNRVGRTLFVENKSGKVLYTKTFEEGGDLINNPLFLQSYQRLIDINNDGKRELLTAGEFQDSLQYNSKYGSITCYDYRGKQIWNYLFSDSISSPGEVLSTNYTSNLLDTTSINGHRVLIAFGDNKESFGAAIYMLDLKTGKRIFNIFWHPGHIINGFILRSKNVKENNLVFEACNNSFPRGTRRIVVGMLSLDDISGKAPSDRYHDYYRLKKAGLKHYLMLPNDDYQRIITPTKYCDVRQGDFGFNSKDSLFECYIYIDKDRKPFIEYCISADFQKISVVVSDEYAKIRDPYIRSGKLNPPLSDTKEYRNILINQILYWNEKKFVKKKNLNF